VSTYLAQPCDEGVVRAERTTSPAPAVAGRWVLAATILGSSMASIDGTVVNVALPYLQTDLKATVAGVQWVIEAYSLFLAALLLVGGSLGDRLGRRFVFLAGTVIFTAASIICGLAPGLSSLIAARSMQGMGAALLVPGSLSIISSVFPVAQRGRAIGTWAGFSAITTGLGPVAGGWLVQNVSWRAIFFLNVPLAMAVVLISLRWVPDTKDETTGGTDWWGALLATVGLGGIVFGLIQATSGSPVWLVWGAGTLGIASLVAFVLVEQRVPFPMMPLSLFRSRTFLGTNLLTLLLYGALGGVLFFVPFDLIRIQGYSATAAGAALLPFIVIMFTLSRWSGGLIDRYGARLPLMVGPALAGIGFGLFALPGIGGSYWTTFFPAIVVMALGMSVAVAPLTTAVMNAVDREHVGSASGINNAASRVAGLLAIAVFGIIAVAVFRLNLGHALRSLPLTASARQALLQQADKLTGLPVPPHLSSIDAAMVHQAMATAFVGSFRVLMLIGGSLAVLSAAVAGLTIGGGKQRAPADVSPEEEPSTPSAAS